MQVNSTNGYYTNNNINFGAIKATPAAKQYIQENFTNSMFRKLDKLIKQEANNPNNIKLDRKRYEPTLEDVFIGYPACSCDFLSVEAGDKTFNDAHLLSTSIGTIKKAIKYLSKYAKACEKRNINYEILEKMQNIE